MGVSTKRLFEIIQRDEGELLAEWMRMQNETLAARRDRISENQLRANSQNFIMAFREALSAGDSSNTSTAEWASLRKELEDLSKQRAAKGFSSTETALFVLSFKRALFQRLRQEYSSDPSNLVE